MNITVPTKFTSKLLRYCDTNNRTKPFVEQTASYYLIVYQTLDYSTEKVEFTILLSVPALLPLSDKEISIFSPMFAPEN